MTKSTVPEKLAASVYVGLHYHVPAGSQPNITMHFSPFPAALANFHRIYRVDFELPPEASDPPVEADVLTAKKVEEA